MSDSSLIPFGWKMGFFAPRRRIAVSEAGMSAAVGITRVQHSPAELRDLAVKFSDSGVARSCLPCESVNGISRNGREPTGHIGNLRKDDGFVMAAY